jgi:hypothetical protein
MLQSKGDLRLLTLHLDAARSHTTLYELRHAYDPPPNNSRMNLCASLAEAILRVHSLSLVPKNVRPGNLLLVPNEQERAPEAVLIGRAACT